MALTLTAIPGGVTWQGRHGVSIVRPLLFWGNTGAAYASPYKTDPEDGSWSSRWDGTKLATIVAQGYDFVRLPIDPGIFLEPLETANTTRFNYCFLQVTAAIDAILAAGLKVLVDLHVKRSGDWGGPTLLAGPAAAEWLLYLSLVQEFAARLSGYAPHLLAIELYNEPVEADLGVGVSWTDTLSVTLVATARAAMPYHTFLISGGDWGGYESLILLTPSNYGSNILYGFHPYFPSALVFQDNTTWPYTSRLEWPPQQNKKTAAIATMTANVNASSLSAGEKTAMISDQTYNLGIYYTLDAAFLGTELDNVVTWRTTHSLPADAIIGGEFGVTRDQYGATGADDKTQARWLRDMINAMNQRGFRWCYWSCDGGNYNNTDGTSPNNFGAFVPLISASMKPPNAHVT